jgi:hypothetical protein
VGCAEYSGADRGFESRIASGAFDHPEVVCRDSRRLRPVAAGDGWRYRRWAWRQLDATSQAQVARVARMVSV